MSSTEQPTDNQGNPVDLNIVMTQWLTTSQAAEQRGFTTHHVTRLCRTGRIRGYYTGNDWRVDPLTFEQYTPNKKGRKRKH